MKQISSLILIFTSLLLAAQDPGDIWKLGNGLYAEEKYSEAEIEYRKAIEASEELNENLEFNLGDALYKQKRYKEAGEQFSKVAAMAEDEALKAKALHNLGNCFIEEKKLKEAISSYKNSLRLNPNDHDTRYNLSHAMRALKRQQQQEQKQDSNKVEPSEFAKKLKETCEALVRNHQFAEALSKMQAGLEKDETVAAYNSFIKKIQDVVEIENQ